MIGGVDEAGRGPVLGPLVVAGVCIDHDDALVSLGVRDSKQLTPSRRTTLSQHIINSATAYEILVIPAVDIDTMRQVMTLNDIEVNAFAKVIERLKPAVCYVDSADVNDTRFGRNILSRLSFQPRMVSKHKADEQYPVVSAASILAKTRRDQEVAQIEQKLSQKLGIPLGSGYPADPVTKHFLQTWIDTYGELPPEVRQSWKTAQRLIQKHNTKTLDDFKTK